MSRLPEFGSEHFTININIQIRILPHKFNNIARWVQFQRNINEIPSSLKEIDITQGIENLTKAIRNEIKAAAHCATNKIFHNEFYRLDPHVRRLTRNKNRARKIYHFL